MAKYIVILIVAINLGGCSKTISPKMVYSEDGSKAFIDQSETFSLGGLEGEIATVSYEHSSEIFGIEKFYSTILSVNGGDAHLVTINKDETPKSYKVTIGKIIDSSYQINTHDLNEDGEFDTLIINKISKNGDRIELTDMDLDGQYDMRKTFSEFSQGKLPHIWIRGDWHQWVNDDSGSYVIIDGIKVYVEMDENRVFHEKHE